MKLKGIAAACTLLLLLLLSTTADALEPEDGAELVSAAADNSMIFQNGGLSGPQTLPDAENDITLFDAGTDAVYRKIYSALLSCQSTISLAESDVTLEQVQIIYPQVINDHPELFYVSSGEYLYEPSTGNVASIACIITYTAAACTKQAP